MKCEKYIIIIPKRQNSSLHTLVYTMVIAKGAEGVWFVEGVSHSPQGDGAGPHPQKKN